MSFTSLANSTGAVLRAALNSILEDHDTRLSRVDVLPAGAEVSITAAAELTTGTWNRVYATASAIPCTLPAPAANIGKLVSVRSDPTSAYLVTISGTFSDGYTTYPLVPRECITLKADANGWQIISQNTVEYAYTPGTDGVVTGATGFSAMLVKTGRKVDLEFNIAGASSIGNGFSISLPWGLTAARGSAGMVFANGTYSASPVGVFPGLGHLTFIGVTNTAGAYGFYGNVAFFLS